MNQIPFKKLFFQTIISAFLSFSTFAIGFLRVYYFSKHLSMEEFGVLSLMLTLSAFLMYIFTLGSFQFLFKSVNEDEKERKIAFWASLLITIAISAVCILITNLFIDEIATWLNLSHFKSELNLVILATATTSVMMIFLFFHYGLGRNNFQNFLQFLRGSLWVVISIFFSLYFDMTLYSILLTINLCMCLILLLSFPWREIFFLFSVKFKDIILSKLIRYCIPLFPYFASMWGIPMIIRAQLNIYEGAKNVAIFSVAYTLMEIVFMFISTITATLSPHFFSESSESGKPGLFYNIMLKYSIVSIMLIVPFVFILRYDIILLVASEKYRIAGNYIPILIFFPLLRVLVIVFEQYYLKTSQTIYLGVIYTIGMLLTFLLSTILIPAYSIFGAIYASLASYLLIFICLYFKQKGIIDFGYLKIPAIIILILIIWTTVFMLSFFNFSNYYKIFPLGIITLLSLFFLPILNKQERNKMLTFFKIKKNEQS